MYKLAGILLLLSTSLAFSGDEPITSGGDLLSSAEIDKWSITIYQNGRNLPESSGNAIAGESIYKDKCLFCHGIEGDNGSAPRLKGLEGYPQGSKNPLRAISVGAWPFATTIFDYTRRAMPHNTPKSLSDAEVYALTAYILYLNNLVKRDFDLNKSTLMAVEMPNHKKLVNVWDKQSRLNHE